MAHYTYNNLVLSNKYNTILATEVNMNQFVTLDNTLTQGAGDTKRIVFRSVTGDVDEVAMGEGNTHSIEVNGYYKDYVLKTIQGHGFYYDEQAQKDPMVVDTMLTGMAETMTNSWNDRIMSCFNEAAYNEVVGGFDFVSFVDAIAKFKEQSSSLFALVNPNGLAALKKALKDDLKYVEAFSRTGYIGTVAGVPIYMSNIIPEGEVIIATKEAVTAFINKTNEWGQDRDADKRKNDYWVRTVAVIALTNEKKVCRIASAAGATTAITTKTGTTIARTATDGATVNVYVNGKLVATVKAEGGNYSATLNDALVAGDAIHVVARKEGQVSSSADATAA